MSQYRLIILHWTHTRAFATHVAQGHQASKWAAGFHSDFGVSPDMPQESELSCVHVRPHQTGAERAPSGDGRPASPMAPVREQQPSSSGQIENLPKALHTSAGETRNNDFHRRMRPDYEGK